MAEVFGTIIRPQEKKISPEIIIPQECQHLNLDKRQAKILFGPISDLPMSKSLARTLSGYNTLYDLWQDTDYWRDGKKKWSIRQASHGGAIEEVDILFDRAGLMEDASQIAS